MFRGSRVRRVFSSSVGTKLLIGLTGLALFAYLIVHLAGNLLILGGQDTFNEYSHRLISNPLVVPIEIGLLLIFLIHVYKTAKMWIDNQSARPVRYQKTAWAGHTSRKSVASTTMIYSGLTIFLLVLIHVKQFKFGHDVRRSATRRSAISIAPRLKSSASRDGSCLYLIFVGLVAAHLRHGIASAVQSLGLNHPIYTKRIVFAGTILAVVIGAGFAIIPLWVLLTRIDHDPRLQSAGRAAGGQMGPLPLRIQAGEPGQPTEVHDHHRRHRPGRGVGGLVARRAGLQRQELLHSRQPTARAQHCRAGRHQRREELPERRRQHPAAVLRHDQGRRLPVARGERLPAGAAQREHHRPVRRPGRAVRA